MEVVRPSLHLLIPGEQQEVELFADATMSLDRHRGDLTNLMAFVRNA
jgi:hypothetical protein